MTHPDRLQRLLGDDAPGAGLDALPPLPAPELDLDALRVAPVPRGDAGSVWALLERLGVARGPCPGCGADDGDHHETCPVSEENR